MTGWIILALVIIAIAVSVGIYNSLVNKRNEYKNAFAQIDVQLTRRYDLIPNLVEVARKYLQHEQETLTSVIAARNHAANALKNTGGGTSQACSMTSNAAFEAVTPLADAWNWAPTWRSGSKTSGASMMTASP